MSNNMSNGIYSGGADFIGADFIIGPSVPLTPFFSLTLNGDCVARGVGMRNINQAERGKIDMTGLVPAGSVIIKSFLYWSYIREASVDPNPNGILNGTPIVGSPVALGIGSPCWVGAEVLLQDVFRADVTGIATSGINSLTGFPSGVQDNSNPLVNQTPPLLEGASLVLIFSNPSLSRKTIIINDGGVSFSADTISTTLSGFQASNSPQAKTIYIVADGQTDLDFFLGDQALFNDTVVAGPTSLIRPKDAFPGQDGIGVTGDPRFGLWDTLEVDVSALIKPGDTTATAAVFGDGDCLTYIAQVLCVTAPEIEPEACPIPNPQTCCQVAVEFKTQLVPPALAAADFMTEVFFTQAPVIEDVCPEKVIICGTVAKRITYTAVDEQGKQCTRVICDERAFQCIIDREDASEGDPFEVCGFAILCEGTPRLQNRGTRPGPNNDVDNPVDVFWKVLEKDIVKVCIRKNACNDCRPLNPPC